MLCYALLVLTGGAVRLTGSGLGCPDWPTCYAHHFTAAVSFHQRVEDTNRLVTVVVSVLSVLVLLAALARSPRRRDLIGLSALVFAGLIAQVVLGGLVVLFKLNPYLVALHFLLTLAVLLAAIALRHRATGAPTPALAVVDRGLIWLVRAQIGALGLVITIGTMVTGAGPHAGGVGTKRVPIAFRDIAELHSTVALFTIGLSLGALFAVRRGEVPAQVVRRARLLLEVLAIQGALGFTQYALHDASVVIEFHLAGATAAWCSAIWLYLSLHRHPLETRDDPAIRQNLEGNAFGEAHVLA